MKALKKLELVRIVVGSIVVIITLIWAIANYFDLHQSSVSSATSKYSICISDDVSRCPNNMSQLTCKAPIASWIKEGCQQYSLHTKSKELGGSCGVSIIEVACF